MPLPTQEHATVWADCRQAVRLWRLVGYPTERVKIVHETRLRCTTARTRMLVDNHVEEQHVCLTRGQTFDCRLGQTLDHCRHHQRIAIPVPTIRLENGVVVRPIQLHTFGVFVTTDARLKPGIHNRRLLEDLLHCVAGGEARDGRQQSLARSLQVTLRMEG